MRDGAARTVWAVTNPSVEPDPRRRRILTGTIAAGLAATIASPVAAAPPAPLPPVEHLDAHANDLTQLVDDLDSTSQALVVDEQDLHLAAGVSPDLDAISAITTGSDDGHFVPGVHHVSADGSIRTEDPTTPGPARQAELSAVAWLRSLGLHTVDHPPTPTFSITGRGINPDLGLRLGIAGPVFDLPGGPIDTIGEVKVQRTPGTAADKLTESIERYARLSDIHGVPAVIFHDLDGALEPTEIARWERMAANRCVGFVRIGSVTATELRATVAALVERRRSHLADVTHLRALVAAHGLEMLTAAVRQAEEDQATTCTAPQPELSALLW